jgi:hypothetical protein
MDSAILLALIKDKKSPVEETLFQIPYIHAGYTNILLTRDTTNGNERTGTND